MAKNGTPQGLLARIAGRLIGSPGQAAEYIPPGGGKSLARSAMDGLQNFVTSLGTVGDKRYYNDYGVPIVQDHQRLRNMWRQSWLAKNIVQIPADDIVRAWVTRRWDGSDADAKTRELLEKNEARLQQRRKTWEAMIWGRLFGGSGIVPILRDDFRNWRNPLKLDQIKVGSLIGWQVFDRWRISPGPVIDNDPASENCGLPVSYFIGELQQTEVHWTRLIRFGGDILPWLDRTGNSYWDDSVLQAPLDAVKDFDASTGGAASMIWEANVDIIRAEGFKEEIGTDEGTAIATKRWFQALLMKSFNRTLILDKDREEYTQKQNQFSGVKDIMDKLMLNVAGAARIPVTKLFRQSPAGMDATGDSDIKLYDDDIDGIRQRELLPNVRRMDEIRMMSLFGRIPEDFDVKANPLRQMTEDEQANVDKTRVDTWCSLIDAGVATPGLVAREMDLRGTMSALEQEDIDAAEEYEKPAPPAAPGASDPDNTDPEGGPPSGGEDDEAIPGDSKATADSRRYVGDSMAGDYIERCDDGWHAYAGDQHIGGPYKTDRGAMGRLRGYSRSFRKSKARAKRSSDRGRARARKASKRATDADPEGRIELAASRPSKRAELFYRRNLLEIVAQLREEGAAILSDLKPADDSAVDPAAGVARIAQALRSFSDLDAARQLASDVAEMVLADVDAKLDRALTRSVRANLAQPSKGAIDATFREAIDANVDLIASIPVQFFERVAAAFSSGGKWSAIVAEVQEAGRITANRAELIAGDQVSKLTSAFNRVRQTAAGIDRYRWTGKMDERERPSHRKLEGRIFRWDSPPLVDDQRVHPGEAINCRCVPVPVIDA